MLFVLISLTILFGLLSWRNLHTGLWIILATLPSYLLRIDIFGIPTTLLELFLLTFFVIWIYRRKKLPISLQKENWGVIAPMFLLLIAATISIVISPQIVAALGIWKAYFVEPFLLFLIFKHEFIQEQLDTDTLFEALGMCALVLSCFAIVQWITGAGIPIPWDVERRVTSVFEYPNALGLFLGPISIIAILQSITLKKIKKIFWIVTSIFTLTAIILAQSEAALVATLATLFLMGILHKKTRPMSLGLSAIVLVLVAFFPTLQQKLTLQDYSGTVRLSQWSETINMLQDHWLWGAGLGGYPVVFEPYHQSTHLEIFQYPHNILFNIWVELGLLGVIATIALGSTLVTIAYKQKIFTHPLSITGISFFALFQMCIHGLVDVPYFKNDLAVLTWMLLAFFFSYVHQQSILEKKT